MAVLPGSDPNAKAVLLLGHIDVVEAKREDWTRDPFTLIEENGYFYGRGAADMKSQVAAWVDTMMRLKEEGFEHRRTVKMALTCGEETSTAFNGASYLSTHERDLIDAEFALNEGGGGRLDADGKPLMMTIQAAEKFPQNYQLEVTNPGGHSSRPMPDNAIYRLAAGLTKISAYVFPIQASDITRQYFAKLAPQVGGEMGAAMTAFAKDPRTHKAAAHAARPIPLITHPAHHLRRHAAERRPCQQRPAPARRRQHQLPHLPRHHARTGARQLAGVRGRSRRSR